MPMRIAHVTCVWPPYCGGVGIAASEQARHLVSLGHQVTIFTPAYHGQGAHTEVWHGVQVVFLRPLWWWGNAACLPQLWWRLKEFDIIHLQLYFIGSTWCVIKAAKWFSIPLFVQYQNDLVGQGLRKILFRWYTHLALPQIVQNAYTVLVLSEEHRRASDIGKLITIIQSRYAVVPNGVDTKYFKPGPFNIELRNSLGIKNNELVLLFVGGIDRAHYFKGLEYILSAVTELRHNNLSVVLLVVGRGELVNQFKKQSVDLGIADHVKWIGSLAHDDLPDYYRLADIFISASYEVESFSIVNVEAMSCGIPVVTTDLPGPQEVVGDAGMVVQRRNASAIAQAVTYVLQNKDVRNNLGQKGRWRAEHNFSWSIVVEKLLTLYEAAIKH